MSACCSACSNPAGYRVHPLRAYRRLELADTEAEIRRLKGNRTYLTRETDRLRRLTAPPFDHPATRAAAAAAGTLPDDHEDIP